MIDFERDPEKAEANFRKHRVRFSEAASVFCDLLGITISDPDHSEDEARYITIGMSRMGRPLLAVHTERGVRIRIISARDLARAERQAYENEIKRRKS